MLLESPVSAQEVGADFGGTPATHTPFVFRNVQQSNRVGIISTTAVELVPIGLRASNMYRLVLLFCLSALASGTVCFSCEETTGSVLVNIILVKSTRK